jgi:lysophospholipase L1-like esterase
VAARRSIVLALLICAAAAPAASAQTGGAEAPAVSQLLVVGDSLGVGMRPYLGGLLADREIRWDVRSGRTTPQGMQRLRAQLRHLRPQVVVVSLGTNDGSDARRFADRVQRTLAAIPPGACVVWAAISRPPRKGAFLALNRVLRASADPRLRIVDWDKAVAAGRVALPDGLHPDAAGYLTRSRMVANAIARCRGG